MDEVDINDLKIDDNNDISNQISEFESANKYHNIIPQDEDSEDDGIPETMRLEEKNKLLIDQLYQKNEELAKLKKIVSLVEKGQNTESPSKDKKLISLAKKNRNLNLQNEALKAKASKAMEEIKRLREEITAIQSNKENKKDLQSIPTNFEMEVQNEELKSKIQKIESSHQALKKKHQEVKSELKKAMLVIKKEVGEENANLDLLLKGNGWKGRAEKISKLHNKLQNATGMRSVMSSISGMSVTSTSFASSKFGDKSTVGESDRKRKEIEKLTEELNQLKEEQKGLKLKYAAATSRISSLEKEIKEFRASEAQKIQVFIEKSENDNKLIDALKLEIKKVKLNKKTKYDPEKGENEKLYKQLKHESVNMNAEVNILKDELRKKETIIKDLHLKIMEGGGSSIQFNEEDLMRKLKEENVNLKKQLKSKFPNLNASNPETDRIIQDLSRQNVKLRKQIDDLQQKIQNLNKN